MGKATGFMEFKREKVQEQRPLERLSNWGEYASRLSDEKLQTQGARCMDCGTPFCHMGIEIRGTAAGCPIQNVIPEWNDLVYKGKWQEALERLHMTNNFPEFTGRVCPAPCEGSCTLAITDPAVAIKSIERTIIDKGFENGWITPRIPASRTGFKVAIVGSGPAGLAAADQLNQLGHSVTVFERSDRFGGLLMYGIPNMKLEKDVIERRVHLLSLEGIDFVPNTEIGKDITKEQLQADFDAVILCTGAQKQRVLHLEGSDAGNIHLAMDYLTDVTKSLLDSDFTDNQALNVEGKDVIVIGGGDTGADCVATALRQKCRSVYQFGKHPQQATTRTDETMWPKDPNIYTMDYAYAEADAKFGRDPREYCIQTTKIEKDSKGNVKALHTIQMEKILGEDGFHYFKELPGTEKVWPVQHVFVAIGFEGAEKETPGHFGVELTNNRIRASVKDYETNIPGVFAAGDARRGQSLVVWAIKEGRGVAASVHYYLNEMLVKS
ncbi:Glutamate synthase [NADPH] small chain [Solibacillus isronensis B3W22]|uniref:Glutamate synthase [NADPH] small chain n=1 Tax=Solibacillus isronensis B3W22 TaxID=1224748 RepID=K1LG72_9BACL|nr:glutamate synthase small subunit [Solibacillus isronensis]AMO86492.1 glutamate synthase [Solibacillus silvestris]EKB43504.1 Glutamate synthase [NADPH] small chain [Solibacillus isronensis B3W22]